MKYCQVCRGVYIRKRRECERDWSVRKFCSLKCAYKGRNNHKGERRPLEVTEKMKLTKALNPLVGEMASNWKGGRPICKFCGQRCSYKSKGYCFKCLPQYQQKENHPRWKGGVTIGENKKGYGRLHCLKRRAYKLRAGGEFSVEEWGGILRRFGNKCLACGRGADEITISVDHVVPLSKGGTNSIDNIQPLCRSCNSKKHAKIIDYRLLIA